MALLPHHSSVSRRQGHFREDGPCATAVLRTSCEQTEFGKAVKSCLFLPTSEDANHFMEKSKALSCRKGNIGRRVSEWTERHVSQMETLGMDA